MPTNALGDRVSRPADDDVGFDSRGYVLAPGDDGPNTVKKATDADDSVVGVNYRSTLDLEDQNVDTGRPVAVQLDGYGPVLAAGDTYELGDAVYVDSLNHEAGVVSKTGDGVFVGTVMDEKDTSEYDIQLVQVNFTGKTGAEPDGGT